MEVDPIYGENVVRPDGAIAPVVVWDTIADWWRGEAADDPVYREDVAPMLSRLMEPATAPILDLGCGDGQWLRWLERDVGRVIGCDRSGALLADAGATHPVALCELPSLAWLQGQTLGTAFSVFVFDLVENIDALFAEVGRVVVPGGSLVVIINHPAFTAPGSGPFMDPDLDIFWRWGEYLERGTSLVPAGSGEVKMYHRSTGDLLTSAAQAGWQLEEMIEAPLGSAAIERDPSYAGQEGIPRFLGVRWRR
jgi:SAM-dependent methyltransferase